jgi:2-amino-4-hydroxy-6-hydroxymethyldihydropteridine diphosphokinase
MTEQTKSRAFLGFGGNLGDPLQQFRAARRQLATHPRIDVLAASPLYRTPALGGPAGQPDNQKRGLAIATEFTPEALLDYCRALETAAGRSREIHWGPRTLDIDLLFFADLVLNTPLLRLPHPRLHQRHFVLLPLVDLAPQQQHPQLKKTTRELLELLPAAVGITQQDETW